MDEEGLEDYGGVALTVAFYGCCEAAKSWGGGLLVLCDLSAYLGGRAFCFSVLPPPTMSTLMPVFGFPSSDGDVAMLKS